MGVAVHQLGGAVEESSEHQEIAASCCGALEDATPHTPATVKRFPSKAIGEK
jgi:hypothetical protein